MVWGKRISKKTTEATLKQMREMMQRGAAEVLKSIAIAALRALLGIGPIQDSISVNALSKKGELAEAGVNRGRRG